MADPAVGMEVQSKSYKFRQLLANNTAAYTDKDAFGAKFTLTNAFRTNLSGFFQHLVLTCADPANAPDLTLFLFDTDIGTYANNASFAVTDAEMLTCLGHIDIASTDWRATANNSIVTLKGLSMLLKSLDGNLYCQFMIRSATTMTSSNSVNVYCVTAPD